MPIALEVPGINECEPDKNDEHLELIAAMGIAHETAFLEQHRHDGHQIPELDAGSASLADTIDAMQQRKEIIFQARLEHGIFGGVADFLVRTTGPSVLGDHHYEVWDTKLARTPRASFIIQLCAYSDMLEHTQGRRPKGFEVVLCSLAV